MLTRDYFREKVMVGDPFFRWAGQTLSEKTLLVAYRAAFFYGATRWVAWTVWAHLVHSFKLDISWGGPHWVKAIQASQVNAAACNCPCCRAARPTFVMYAVVALTVRFKRFRARIASSRAEVLSRQLE